LACPIGSLSGSLNDLDRKLPFYMVGTLLAFGVILGRTICGWACPFGLLQDLLDKIPLPKLAKNKITRRATGLKYVMLFGLVIAVPFAFWLATDVAYPAFCGWICPAGTLEAGIPLTLANESLRMFLGPLFSWKMALLIAFLITCLFVYRPFCRFICPLGALLSFFNRFSLLGYRIDHSRCTSCGDCVASCKMDVKEVSDRECIQCGNCAKQCPSAAIRFSLTKKTASEQSAHDIGGIPEGK
jgi:polyferredoxin